MRLTRFSLVAVLVGLGAAMASTTASAASREWYVKSKPLAEKPAEAGVGAGEEDLAATSAGSFTMTTSIAGGAKVVITCGDLALTGGKLASHGLGGASAITLGECKVTQPSSCKIVRKLETYAVVTELFGAEGSEVWNQYKPESGNIFVTIGITGCSGEGNYPLTGTICAKEIGTSESIVKQMAFGSKPRTEEARPCALRFMGSPTTLAGTLEAHLDGPQVGAPWTGR